MYKVSEVAEMLSVEKVKIFEALILHDETLAPYITKERHLTYISEVGVRKLEQLLFNQSDEDEVECIEEIETDYNEMVKEDHLDVFIKKNENKKLQLRNEIIDLKRHLSLLDKEIRIKDDAVMHYQEILKDDLSWIKKLEGQLEQLISNSVEENQKVGFFNKLKK
jgi:hypothetical protein